jgi:hypothetical protein
MASFESKLGKLAKAKPRLITKRAIFAGSVKYIHQTFGASGRKEK